MNNRDFMYWIQGYFELAPLFDNVPRNTLSSHQCKSILKHIALVEKTEPLHWNISFIQGYIEGAYGPEEGLNQEQSVRVAGFVSKHFKHIIDPQAGPQSVQDALNHIHSPPFDPNTTIIRC